MKILSSLHSVKKGLIKIERKDLRPYLQGFVTSCCEGGSKATAFDRMDSVVAAKREYSDLDCTREVWGAEAVIDGGGK